MSTDQCRKFRESDELELDKYFAEEFASHVAICGDCETWLVQSKYIVDLVGDLALIEPPAQLLDGVMKKIDIRKPVKKERFIVLSAACFLVILCLLVQADAETTLGLLAWSVAMAVVCCFLFVGTRLQSVNSYGDLS